MSCTNTLHNRWNVLLWLAWLPTAISPKYRPIKMWYLMSKGLRKHKHNPIHTLIIVQIENRKCNKSAEEIVTDESRHYMAFNWHFFSNGTHLIRSNIIKSDAAIPDPHWVNHNPQEQAKEFAIYLNRRQEPKIDTSSQEIKSKAETAESALQSCSEVIMIEPADVNTGRFIRNNLAPLSFFMFTLLLNRLNHVQNVCKRTPLKWECSSKALWIIP